MEPGREGRVVQFGSFEADIAQGTLTKTGVRIRLQEQPFRILALLLDHAGQLVTRGQIREELWSQDTFVEFDKALNTAVGKLRVALNDSADNPRFLETVPRRGYRFVAPVTVLRTGSVVAQTPTSESVGSAAAVRVPPSNHTRYWLAAALVLVLVGGAVYFFRAVRPSSVKATGKSSPINARRSVAVLGFRNLPGRPEEDWLDTAFTEMLSTELAAGGSLRLVSGEDVVRAKRDLRIADANSLSSSTLANLRINPGVDLVVLGSYTPVEEKGEKRIRVDLRLQDTLSGETISEEAVTGTEGRLFEVATQAGARLRERLGAAPVSVGAMNSARASLPSNETALRLFAEGRAKLWNFEYLAARDLLLKAEALDPGNAAVHLALADAWSASGYERNAQEEAKQAVDLSSPLSREEQLYAEGRYRDLSRDWPKAIENYRALTQFFPDNLEYGLRLAAAFSQDGKAQDSLHAIEALRLLPKPISDDPRIDLQEALTCDHSAEYQCSKKASASAASKAQKQGARMVLAEAKLMQSQAASRQDDPKGAMALDEEAQQIFEQAGDKYGVARARYRMGDLLFRQGQFAQSNAILEEGLRDFRVLGNDGYVAATLNDIAGGLMEMGEIAQAKTMYEQALVARRLVRDKRGIADTMTNLAIILQREGDLVGATRCNEESLALYQEIGEKDAVAFMQLNMSGVLVDRGDLSRAKALLDQSLAIQRTLGNSSDVAEVLFNLGGALRHQGDIAGAQKSYDEALAIRISRGEDGNVAQTRLGQAELLLDSGKPVESESLARSALEQFKKENRVEEEVSAHAILATTLLELGRLADAKAEVAQLTKLARTNQSYSSRLNTEIVAARVLSGGGKSEDAARSLQRTIKDAQKTGFFVRQLEATLALAEIEAKSGKKQESQDLLHSVEKDARGKGFLLIARRAVVDRD
jgi:tetratricopeptide (TPR) repeat protein/DNA-binding winged helix-turn-helix (wHTH) protein